MKSSLRSAVGKVGESDLEAILMLVKIVVEMEEVVEII